MGHLLRAARGAQAAEVQTAGTRSRLSPDSASLEHAENTRWGPHAFLSAGGTAPLSSQPRPLHR